MKNKSARELVGKNLRAHRSRLGISQAAMAELLGVTKLTVGRWERADSAPSLDQLDEIAAALDLGVRALFRR